jgi:hypothetical protein
VILQCAELHAAGPRQGSHTQVPVPLICNDSDRNLQDFLPSVPGHELSS